MNTAVSRETACPSCGEEDHLAGGAYLMACYTCGWTCERPSLTQVCIVQVDDDRSLFEVKTPSGVLLGRLKLMSGNWCYLPTKKFHWNSRIGLLEIAELMDRLEHRDHIPR